MPDGKMFTYLLYEKVEEHFKNFEEKRGITEWKGSDHGEPGYWFDVDVQRGRYRFDCHGFVRYMINDTFNGNNWRNDIGGNTTKNQYESWERPMRFIGQGKKHPWNWSGSNEEWWQFGEDVKNNGVYQRYQYVTGNPRRGDILITKKHLMIAMASPDDKGHLLIADSCGGHGGEDNRTVSKQIHGMGKGKIKMQGNKTSWTTALNSPIDIETLVVRLVN